MPACRRVAGLAILGPDENRFQLESHVDPGRIAGGAERAGTATLRRPFPGSTDDPERPSA